MGETSNIDAEPKATWKNLTARATSGLIFAAICFVPFYIGGIAWTIATGLLASLMIWEWVRMSDPNPNLAAFIIPIAGLIFSIICLQHGGLNMAAICLVGFAIIAGVERLRRGGAQWAAFGVLYIGVPALVMILLRGNEMGMQSSGFKLLFFLMLIVITADTAAYFGGSYFKGPKLVPKLSPKKTWSGFFTGGLATILVSLIVLYFFGQSVMFSVIIAIPIFLLSVAGDFLESGLKRILKVKDTGSVLPGHGGLLDRLDSLMLVLIAAGIFLHYYPQYWPV